MSVIEISSKVELDQFVLNVKLQIPSNGVTSVIGQSGSGKTTLLRWMAGLIRGKEGFLKIGEEVWEDSENGICLPPHKRSVGFVFQENNLFPHLSVIQNLEYALKRVPKMQPNEDIASVTKKTRIETLVNRMPHELSGGQRQRVALARSLLMNPKLLLLDEPLSALDDFSKEEIFPCLDFIRAERKVPILFVTHSQKEVRRFADQVIQLKQGRIFENSLFAAQLIDKRSERAGPVAISLIGQSGAGKTTLIEALIPKLKNQGWKVGAVKHDAHDFEIDHPGKDSYRFFHAGADSVSITSKKKIAFVSVSNGITGIESLLEKQFYDMDIVLIEGFKSSSLPKILVFRGEAPDGLIDLSRGPLLAIATDKKAVPGVDCHILDINDHQAIASFILDSLNKIQTHRNL